MRILPKRFMSKQLKGIAWRYMLTSWLSLSRGGCPARIFHRIRRGALLRVRGDAFARDALFGAQVCEADPEQLYPDYHTCALGPWQACALPLLWNELQYVQAGRLLLGFGGEP